MGVVDVADLEAGAVAREAAGAEGVEPALVRELGERVDLVHELRELRGAEELLDRRDDGLDGDEVLGADRVRLLEAHALLGDALHAAEGALHHVREELADRAHAAVAEVVDIVDVGGAVVHVHEVLHRRDDVGADEGELLHGHRVVEFLVELVAAHLAEVVAAPREEHVREVALGVLDGDGLAGHEGRVDRRQGVGLGGLVLAGVFLDELDVLALEAVEDHVEVEASRDARSR